MTFSPTALAADDSPKGEHLTWSLNDVHETINVSWWTNSADNGDIVLYDDESNNGNPEEYEHKA